MTELYYTNFESECLKLYLQFFTEDCAKRPKQDLQSILPHLQNDKENQYKLISEVITLVKLIHACIVTVLYNEEQYQSNISYVTIITEVLFTISNFTFTLSLYHVCF